MVDELEKGDEVRGMEEVREMLGTLQAATCHALHNEIDRTDVL